MRVIFVSLATLMMWTSIGCSVHSQSSVLWHESGLLLDTSRSVSDDPSYDVKDTLWHVEIYYENHTRKATDTAFLVPADLPENGEYAQPFFGNESDLRAYAERKHRRKFCYKDKLGIFFLTLLKENENYALASARFGMTEKAIAIQHGRGWSKLITDMGWWMGDTLIISGQNLCLATGADAIIPSQYH